MRFLPSLGVLAFVLLSNVGTANAQTPWRASMDAAQRSYQSRDFVQAVRHFDDARLAIGEPFAGGEPWSTAETLAYDATRCPRALARLTFNKTGSDEDGWERRAAITQADYACGPAEKAVAALLMGDGLQAALRLQDCGLTTFPRPFAAEYLPHDTHGFTLEAGALPSADNTAQARRYIQALAGLRYGLETRCREARGIDWTAPGEARDIDTLIGSLSDEEIVLWERQRTLPPFQGTMPDALATVSCTYLPSGAPEIMDSLDEASTQTFLLRREANGHVAMVGSYRDFPSLSCWTSVVQSVIGNSQTSQRGLYLFVRSEGYSENEGPEELVVTATLCDVERGRCRSVPVQIRQRDYAFEDGSDEATEWRRDWRSRLSVRRGRVRLLNLTGAPPELAIFRRGVPFEVFFSSPDVEYTVLRSP